jgi:serine/threonine-protein kinase
MATLGRGGHSTVYKVKHRQTGMIAALKAGPDLLQLEEDALERFQQEFQAIAPLSHPSIVRVLELAEHLEVPYLVLEYVPGLNLDEHVKDKGVLQLREAIAVFRQVTDGLRYLHANQIVHRDIKPSNILLATYGQAKLADFGLLKRLNRDLGLTRSRQAMGTIDYGAPEQFEDAKRVDQRCDLYSLAATLYTSLSGRFPFGNGNPMQILQRKLNNHCVPLRLLLPGLDPALDGLVSRCLEPNPARRPSRCDDFLAVLRQCARRPASANAKIPEPASTHEAREPERRASVRFAVDLNTTFVPFHQKMRGRWQATILDISAGGVCLQMPRPVTVHSVLQLTLGRYVASELVFVRWAKPGPGGTQVVGGSFVRPLAIEELEAIRQSVPVRQAAG